MSRKLVFAINVSIDGCCDHTIYNPPEEILDYFTRLTRDADVLLYGRKTYQLMVPYWPDVAMNPAGQTRGDKDFAQAFDSVPRIIVFSKTLSKADGKKTTIFSGGLKEEILKLKNEPGKNILTGGVALPAELVELGLVDEINLVVHPVIAGRGRKLFDGIHLQETLGFKFVDSHVFKSGSIALRYVIANHHHRS